MYWDLGLPHMNVVHYTHNSVHNMNILMFFYPVEITREFMKES